MPCATDCEREARNTHADARRGGVLRETSTPTPPR